MKRKANKLSQKGKNVETAMKRAVRRVIDEAFGRGESVPVWRNGRMVMLRPPKSKSRRRAA